MLTRNKKICNLPALLSLTLIITGCSGGEGDPSYFPAPAPVISDASANYSYSGSGFGIDHISTPSSELQDTLVSYDINLGSSVKDVYFIFTNVSEADTTAPPSVTSNMASPYEKYMTTAVLAENMVTGAKDQGVGIMGRPDISLYNSDPQLYSGQKFLTGNNSAVYTPPPETPVFDTVGQQDFFYPENNISVTVPATLRKISSAGGKTVNIYVADDSWGAGCAKAKCVTQTMLDSLSGKLDAYDLLTDTFGAEWGVHPYTNLIPPDNSITILFFDVDNDNSTNGGLLGYFWAKDNFLAASQPASNERIMLYLDSVMYATPDGKWEIEDTWPEMIVSTFTHELQHMINYYQKNVLRNTSCEVWLNELCSLVAEDFLSWNLKINGPRGVTFSDGTSGAANNSYGRLPRYNRYNYTPISRWTSGSFLATGDHNVLNSYSANYSFGAFLARNFGAANLFRTIVQCDKGDRTAIDFALNSLGTGETFASALQKWGVASLLSNQKNAPQGYRFNTGTFFTSTPYRLGSINLYNYTFTHTLPNQSGPKIYTSLPPGDANAGRYQTSNMFYRLGSNLTGTINTQITLKKGTKVTVLIK